MNRRWLQSGFFLVCVTFSVAAFYNVMSDNAEVMKLAEETACGAVAPPTSSATGAKPAAPPPCSAQMTSMQRNPIAQVFTMATSKRAVIVRCTRAFVMFGDYACTAQ